MCKKLRCTNEYGIATYILSVDTAKKENFDNSDSTVDTILVEDKKPRVPILTEGLMCYSYSQLLLH